MLSWLVSTSVDCECWTPLEQSPNVIIATKLLVLYCVFDSSVGIIFILSFVPNFLVAFRTSNYNSDPNGKMFSSWGFEVVI